jgi:hypothetical protein
MYFLTNTEYTCTAQDHPLTLQECTEYISVFSNMGVSIAGYCYWSVPEGLFLDIDCSQALDCNSLQQLKI